MLSLCGKRKPCMFSALHGTSFNILVLNQTLPPCSSTGVTVHAVVCSVCDPQSGWFNALLSECTDGQVYAHLPGTQIMQVLSSPSSSCQMHRECARNSYQLKRHVCRFMSYTNPLRIDMCAGGEWPVCVLCTHSLVLHHRGGNPGPLPER